MDLVFRIYVFKCFIKVMTNVCGVWILKLFYTILLKLFTMLLISDFVLLYMVLPLFLIFHI